jgi:GDP-L-fucose synthase
MKIYVAGHNGLAGSAIVKHIQNTTHSWCGQSRGQLDLLDRERVFQYIQEARPDAMVIAAAKVGGIGANRKMPVEFLGENLRIQLNLIDAAHEFGVERVLFLGSSCIYPKFAKQPIPESELLTGPLEPTNEPYALAKIAGLKLIQAYRSEYGHKWISLMPTNLYGPRDNFDLNSSHVLPALIRKFHEAKAAHSANVELWGSGAPMREFLHSDDLASACIFALENYDGDIPLNVGSGSEISIDGLAKEVAAAVGYKGTISWNTEMPDGTPRKILDSSLLNSLGWRSKIELAEGIADAYSWFRSAEWAE